MSNIDMAIFNEVMDECPSEVERSMFERAIGKFNEFYREALFKDGEADYRAIRNKALDYCDLWDLFLFDSYKSALGKYYIRRRLKEEKGGYIVGTVYEASANHVLLAVSKRVKILYRAKKPDSKLGYRDVDNGKERFPYKVGGRTGVPEQNYLDAKRQALAIMNSRRKY